MAYVDLATQSAGQTASAAGWANVVKANFESMGPHLLVRKTADESDTVGTLQAEDQLVATVAANEVWLFQYILWINATAGTFAYNFTFPSGSIGAVLYGISNGNTSSSTGASPTTTANVSDLVNTAPGVPYMMRVMYAVGGTGGTLQLQWHRGTSGTTTVKANSTLWGVKLA